MLPGDACARFAAVRLANADVPRRRPPPPAVADVIADARINVLSRIEIVASAVQRWAVVCLLVGIAVYMRLTGIIHINEASFVHYLVFSLPFLLLLPVEPAVQG